MTTLRRLRATWLRLAAFVGRERSERELADEIESHLQLHIDDNLRAGMTPAEARRRAAIALGGVEQAKERYRDRIGLPGLEALLHDLRFGGRMLRRQPGFTAAAVVTLALGFGPPIAIFALANGMVLRPVPGVRDAAGVSVFMTGTPSPRGGLSTGRVSYVNLRDLTPRLHTVELAALQQFPGLSVGRDGGPERLLDGEFVSGAYFDVLGVRMQAGRALGPDDDHPANPVLVAVISDGMWASIFDRSPSAVGQTMTVNGHRVNVVGVAAPDFQGERRFLPVALWMPGVTEYAIRAMEGRRPDDRAIGGYYEFIARLKPGASWPQAEAEMASLTRWLREQHPEANAKFGTVGFHNRGPIGEYGQAPLVRLLGLLFAAASLVLIIASANVASLVLMRGLARREEVALRRALGASRWRVVRQHVTETTLLWLLGATAGLLPVWLLLKSDVTTRLTAFGIPALRVQLEWPIVVFAAGLALVVGLVFSLAPAWKGTTVEPATALRTMGATSARRTSATPILTVLQLAACLTLLVGALMMASTLRHLMSVDLGFEPANVTVFHAGGASAASENAAYGYLSEFTRRLAERPGVDLVAMAYGAPFAGAGNTIVSVRREASDAYLETRMQEVFSPEYFSTLRIRMIRGRTFASDEILADRGAACAVIVSESLARRLFGTAEVIGMTVDRGRTCTIVGVAADVRVSSLTDEPPPTLYSAAGMLGFRNGATVIVRTASTAPIQQHVREVAASLGSAPPIDIRTLEEAVARARGEWDVLAWLMSSLALVATVLAAVGVYGVVAFSAASRRAEFGLRMALGASPSAVRDQVLRGAAIIAAAGLVFGMAGAFGLMQVLRSRLVGVSPFDTVIWASAAVLLGAIVAVASLIPARQATRVSLADTLKSI